MELIFLDLAGVNFVKLLMSLGEIMFFNRINGKCQIIILAVSPVVFAAAKANASEAEPSDNQAKQAEIPDVNTIVDKANLTAYYQGDDGRAKVKMTITDKQGRQRNREFVVLRKDVNDGGDQNYYVYFERPADVRRMVYMVQKHAGIDKEDDRWLYLPALDLVKRIAAGDKRTSFVGSDFLYEDVSGRGTDLDKHELTKTTDEFFVLENTPKNPEEVEFSYYSVSVERKTFMPVKMEYYDKDGKLYRVVESIKVDQIEGFPTTVKSVASDLRTGSKTEMEFTEVDYNIGLGDIFTERYLRRPPREVRR
jgi:outer membrane lipoprotein-sorting protein